MHRIVFVFERFQKVLAQLQWNYLQFKRFLVGQFSQTAQCPVGASRRNWDKTNAEQLWICLENIFLEEQTNLKIIYLMLPSIYGPTQLYTEGGGAGGYEQKWLSLKNYKIYRGANLTTFGFTSTYNEGVVVVNSKQGDV
jgi:hypothetical protein